MAQDTDTNVRQRWEQLVADVERFKAGEIPAGTTADAHRENLKHREASVRRDWDEIIRRKMAGELTDPWHVEEFKKRVQESCLFLGFTVRFIQAESEVDRDKAVRISPCWEVRVLYGGKREDLDRARWDKLMDRIRMERLKDPGVRHNQSGWMIDPTEFPDEPRLRWSHPQTGLMEVFGTDEEDEVSEIVDDDGFDFDYDNPLYRPYRSWIINTRMWDGPAGKLKY